MPVIEVAAGIPCPQSSTVTPEERRLLSEGAYGPRGARTIELDERQFQTLTWALSPVQAALFRDWYRVTLIYGGAWFSAPATWPTPQGLVVKVRRFLGDPQWTYRGNGHWLLAINAEVRGETLLPSEPVPSQSLWLDTFTGSSSTPLTSHAQDVPLSGSVWESVGAAMPELDGTGNASAIASEFGTESTVRTTFGPSDGNGVTLAFPYTLEVVFTPLWQQPQFEFSNYNSIFNLSFDPALAVTDMEFNCQPGVVEPDNTDAQLFFFGPGDTGGEVEGLVEGENILSVLVEADGYTPTLNGTVNAKQSVAEMPSAVYRFYTFLGATTSFTEKVAPFAKVSRTELIGSVA